MKNYYNSNITYFFDSEGEQRSAWIDTDGRMIVWAVTNRATGEENFFDTADQAQAFVKDLVKCYRLSHVRGSDPFKGLEQQGWQAFEARLVQEADEEAVKGYYWGFEPEDMPKDAANYFGALLEDRRSSTKDYMLREVYEHDSEAE